ncbi:gas vesicle protein GvpJ [Halalkalicoccus ordinarius]|uniref:gas vesicle protein GvpJ n=1 Tax=Halalkalicoccus ordinarius TaxID=3116651 RepID=UPI00300F20C1
MGSARPSTSSLAEVLDRILDKGIVVDLRARLSLVGIEMVTVEVRVTVGSVDTFLHYASEIAEIEAVE